MSKYELQKLFFKKSKKLLMTSFFRSQSWSRTLPVSVSKPKLKWRPVLVLVSEKVRGLGLSLGLGRVGLDYSPGEDLIFFGGYLNTLIWTKKRSLFGQNSMSFRAKVWCPPNPFELLRPCFGQYIYAISVTKITNSK